MTGRRLYDKFCDAAKSQPHRYGLSVNPHDGAQPIAWPFLADRDRRVWNALAHNITPKPRKASS